VRLHVFSISFLIVVNSHHGKERRKETGNINASLMALKECIRARAAGKNLSHQYRKSKLTMALKTSFSLSTARTIVIATVSPASKGMKFWVILWL
jgi:kinesin family protein 2/24